MPAIVNRGRDESLTARGGFRGFQMFVQDPPQFFNRGWLIEARVKAADNELRFDVILMGALVIDEAITAIVEITVAPYRDD